jgi:hypothetical protein
MMTLSFRMRNNCACARTPVGLLPVIVRKRDSCKFPYTSRLFILPSSHPHVLRKYNESQIEVLRNKRFFSSSNCRDRFWGPPSLQIDRYWGPFPGVEWPEREVYCLPPSSAEVKNELSRLSALPICLHAVDGDNFTFYFGNTVTIKISDSY